MILTNYNNNLGQTKTGYYKNETYNNIIYFINNQFNFNTNKNKFVSQNFKKILFERILAILRFEHYFNNKLTESEYKYLSGKLSNFLLYNNYEIYYEYNPLR